MKIFIDSVSEKPCISWQTGVAFVLSACDDLMGLWNCMLSWDQVRCQRREELKARSWEILYLRYCGHCSYQVIHRAAQHFDHSDRCFSWAVFCCRLNSRNKRAYQCDKWKAGDTPVCQNINQTAVYCTANCCISLLYTLYVFIWFYFIFIHLKKLILGLLGFLY